MSYTNTIMIPEMGFQAVSCTFDNLVNIHEVTKKEGMPQQTCIVRQITFNNIN